MSSLILLPKPIINHIPNLHTIVNYLQNIKFIGDQLQSSNFLVGDNFLHLITFMGCSPYIELEPQLNNKPFCYVHIDGPWLKPQLRYNHHTKPPRCNKCRQRMIHWQQFIKLWLEYPTQNLIECPHCHQQQCLLDLIWRKDAGCGYLFINIENIYPGEAVPVPKFLTELATITNTTWQYFYIQS